MPRTIASSTGLTVNVPLSSIKHLRHSDQTLSLQSGDVVETFGHITVWDEYCVSAETASELRQQGDPLCDAALEEMFEHTSPVGVDLYSRLEAYVQDNPNGAASRFWHSVHELPPEGIRVNQEQVQLATELFLDNPIQIMQALLYYSLAGGFASPRIVRTLQSVSYLVPKGNNLNLEPSSASNDRIYTRLLETFQFVLDVMGCDADISRIRKSTDYLFPGGEGWKSAIRVRMLHGVARSRVKARLSKQSINGIVPISQEDMSATLSSFSTVPLWALSRLGLRPSRKSMDAFIALWKHVGFYLGVSPPILSRYFININVADKFLASIALHAFSTDEEEEVGLSPTIPILHAVSNRGALSSSFEYNCAAARYFLGSQLSSHLHLPESSWTMRVKLRWILVIQAFPIHFGRIYGRWIRKGWIEKRRRVMSAGLFRALRYALGMRRTVFRPSDMELEMDEDARKEETVVPDYIGGSVLRREWREMIVEMGVATFSAVVLCWSVLWKCKSLLTPTPDTKATQADTMVNFKSSLGA